MTIPDGAVNNAGFDGGGDNSGQDNSGGGINPAWNDVLSVVPKELHSQVTPHLRNWDQGVQNRFQQVQSDWAPFREFKDAGVTPDHIRMGLGLMEAIENNPKQVYDLIAQQFNFGAENDQGDAEPDLTEQFQGLPPEVVQQLQLIPQLQQQLETVTQWAVGQQNSTTAAQEDAQLENLMSELKAKHGEFDEQFVLSQMLSGAEPDDAIAAYNTLVERISTEAQRPRAPKILGSGSVIPGERGLDPKQLNSQQTKDLVVQMLMQNRAQGA